jgi:hypothetical protein
MGSDRHRLGAFLRQTSGQRPQQQKSSRCDDGHIFDVQAMLIINMLVLTGVDQLGSDFGPNLLTPRPI